jgi:transcriptional regulator with PAS, ATPase and Fis domain
MSVVSVSEGEDIITADQLGIPINGRQKRKVEIYDDLKDQGLEKYMESIEKALIVEAIESSGGYISKAAKKLGVKRQTLQYKLKKYDISTDADIL